MKYLALTTAAIALLSTPAIAGEMVETGTITKQVGTHTYVKINDTETIDLSEITSNPDVTKTFDLADNDNKIMIRGQSMKIMQPNGNTFFPPNGPYVTENGLKFFAQDGEVLRVEAPADLILVDADMNVETARTYNSDMETTTYTTSNKDMNRTRSRMAQPAAYEVDVDVDASTDRVSPSKYDAKTTNRTRSRQDAATYDANVDVDLDARRVNVDYNS